MKIAELHLLPLIGSTPDGGWTSGWDADQNLHTLIELVTDEGVTGLGGIYTSRRLGEGAVDGLRRFVMGASVFQPAAASKTLAQNTFRPGHAARSTPAITG